MKLSEHKLIVDYWRDLSAHCSCGLWSVLSLTTDNDTDEALESRVYELFTRHLDSVRRREERANHGAS